MTWYNYSVAFNAFIADLITKLVAEGWVKAEVGYNTVHPASYASIFMLPTLAYGSIQNNEGSSSYNFTYLNINFRAAYNSGSHVPTTTANGGDQRYRLVFNVDLTASATKLLYVKGWIDGNTICIDLKADETQTGWSRHFVFIGEVEAMDAGANTVMMLATEIINRVGDGAGASSIYDYRYSTSFVHALGDSIGYYPLIYGFGASSVSNKARPGLCYIWRCEATVDKPGNVAYRVPTNICRFTLMKGSEGEMDTFIDTAPEPDQTFTRVLNGDVRGSYCGTEQLQRYASAYYDSNLKTNGYAWIRSA